MQVDIAKKIQEELMLSGEWYDFAFAVGATGDFIERAEELYRHGCRVFCIDVAHGHHSSVRSAIRQLRKSMTGIHIMTGNVATVEAFNDLSDWGADSIRVGVGGGSCCSTRIVTGHGVPTLTSIMDCAKSDRPAKLIADGGIRTSGDMVKAFAAGADFVMVGSLLSGTDQSPGSTYLIDDTLYKDFRGMASSEAQTDWRGYSGTEEGVSHVSKHKGDALLVLESLKKGIQSGCSYSGVDHLEDLNLVAKFITQTPHGTKEGSPHVLGS